MTNRFLVSLAVLALIAGTGIANAQNTSGVEPGGTRMHLPPTNAPGAGMSGWWNVLSGSTCAMKRSKPLDL